MSSEPSSLVGAIEDAAGVRVHRSPMTQLPDPEQLELLRGPDGKLPRGAVHEVRTRGRPRGARNKRSAKIAEYYVQKYGDPLDTVGRFTTMPIKLLVDVLVEAADGRAGRVKFSDIIALAKAQQDLNMRAAEYVHGKQPVAIDLRRRTDVTLIVPELLREHGLDPAELEAHISQYGIEAFDLDTLQMLPPPQDAEWQDADDDFDDVGDPGEGGDDAAI